MNLFETTFKSQIEKTFKKFVDNNIDLSSKLHSLLISEITDIWYNAYNLGKNNKLIPDTLEEINILAKCWNFVADTLGDEFIVEPELYSKNNKTVSFNIKNNKGDFKPLVIKYNTDHTTSDFYYFDGENFVQTDSIKLLRRLLVNNQ